MKLVCCSLVLILFAALGGAVNSNQEIVVERATEEEARQVQEVANAFEKRIRETRDAVSLRDLFISDFMRLQMDQENVSRSGEPAVSIPSVPLSIEAGLISKVTREEWERFYFGNLNFRYYFVLLIASRLKAGEIENGKGDFRRKLFPPEVLALLQEDPFLKGEYGSENNQKYTVETVEEFRSLITTMERVSLILRQRFIKNPPESTRIYQQNLRRASDKGDRRIQPDVYGTRETRLGFPLGTRFFHRLTADSMFELWLVKTDAGIKITWARVYPFN